MKKIILTSSLLLVTLFVNAQITVSPGIRGGLNVSDLTNVQNSDSRTDYYIGGYVAIDFTWFYNLQPEINYSRQGTQLNGGGDIELQYISMTVANKFYPVRDSGFNLAVGPSLAIKTSGNLNSGGDSLIEEFDFLLFGGIGYDFPFGLGIEARYNFGFIDIFGLYDYDYDYEDIEFEDLTLNNFFQIGLTYRFNVKKQ